MSRPVAQGASLAAQARVAVALVAMCAFAFDPFGLDRWVFAKELVLVAAAVISVFVVPIGRAPRWWLWWLAGALLLLIVSVSLSAAPWVQFWGRWPRYEGLVTLGAYALAFAVGARLLGGAAGAEETLRRGDYFHAVLSVALVVTAVVGAVEVVGLRPFASDLDRPGSLLGNASDMGIVGVVGLALFLPRVTAPRDGGKQAWNVVGCSSAAALVALSGSRGALVGAAVAMVGVVVVLLIRKERRRRPWTVLAIAAAVMTVAGAAALIARVGTSADTAASSAMNRLPLWKSTWDLIVRNPFTGAGANGFADSVTAFHSDTWFATTGIGRWIESPHSVPLQILAAGGVPAALALGVLVTLALRAVRRNGLRGPFGAAGMLAVGAAAVALLFHFTSPGTTLLLAVVAGASLATSAAATSNAAGRIAKTTALVAWAAALIAAIAADHFLRDGFSALARGDVPESESAFELAATLRPWDADLPLMIAERAADAIESVGTSEAVPTAGVWADRAVTALPSSVRALKSAAVIAQYSGDIGSGIHLLQRAAHLSPADPQVFHRLGGLEFLDGRRADALADLERAAGLAPDDPNISATLEYVRSSGGQ